MKIKASVFFSFLEIEIGESDHQDAMIDDAYSTMSIYSHSRKRRYYLVFCTQQ